MSLYYDAVSILTAPSTGGSFKSRIYSARNLKASPAQIYALIVEASKWDILLKEVIEKAEILKYEPKLTPLLSLLLVHDHLLAKSGIAANANHPLRQAVERHKTRLRAEFTKARVRRGCASVEELKNAVLREKGQGGVAQGSSSTVYPRWVRINNVRTTLEVQLGTTFKAYTRVASLEQLGEKNERKLYVDAHIPDLVAVAYGVDFSSSAAYKNGEIILQDKASCFPAYLLAGNDEEEETWEGDLIDGCAAPGNKTTHLASLLAKQQKKKKTQQDKKMKQRKKRSNIYSMDASPNRSKTLQKMVALSGSDPVVTVLPGQDFLALDPEDPRFENVTGLLLDPSCSGSGIVGREDVPVLTLPESPRGSKGDGKRAAGKKRKRGHDEEDDQLPIAASGHDDTDENELSGSKIDSDRLTKLSNLQARIVEHALSFPAATRVTYSTCSIHLIENESVVSRVLASEVAKNGGWRVMRRDEQPEGLRKWKHRGVRTDYSPDGVTRPTEADALPIDLSDEDLEGCLRCWPGDEEGLGGFFVAGFVRDRPFDGGVSPVIDEEHEAEEEDDEEEAWEGFSD